MDDGLDAPLELRLERQHVAAAPLGNQRLLQHMRAVGVVQVAGEPLHQAGVGHFHFRTDAAERFGRAIQNLTAFGNRLVNQVHQAQPFREVSGMAGQRERVWGVFLEDAFSVARDDQGVADGEQFHRLQGDTVEGLVHHGPQVHRALEAQVGIARDEQARLAGLLLQIQGFFQAAGGAQAFGQVRGPSKAGVGLQARQYFGVFEQYQGFWVHDLKSVSRKRHAMVRA